MIKSTIFACFAVCFFIVINNSNLTANNASEVTQQGCYGCHLQTILDSSPINKNAVHDSTNPGHRSELVNFTSIHTAESAALKKVDLDKVEVYILTLDE